MSSLTLSDWLALLTHFLSLSLLAIGGAITTVPDMHRTLVDQHQSGLRDNSAALWTLLMFEAFLRHNTSMASQPR